MARKRMIDPGIWQNEQLGTLPREARLLFIGMFSNADDEGRLKASAGYLKAIVFPYDDDLPIKRIEELKQVIAAQSLILLYRAAGQDYLWLPTWDRHQKIKNPAPSQLPSPHEGTPSIEQPPDRSGGQNPGRLHTNGEALPEPSDSNGGGLPEDSSNSRSGLPQPTPSARETLPEPSGSGGGGLPQDSPSPGEGVLPSIEEVSRGKDSGSKEKLGEYRLVEGKGSGETIPGPGQPPADGLQPPASSDSDTDKILPEASQGERHCLKLLKGLAQWPFDFQRDLAYLRQLYVEFPRVDMLREVTDFATHAMDKPIKNRGSPRLRLRHWIEKGAQFAEERRQQGERGRDTGRGLSQPGRPPEKTLRTIIRPIESGPDEGIAGVAGRGRVEPIQPADTS